MKYVPFSLINTAKECDAEAVDFILRHFEGYIAKRCSSVYMDEHGNTKFFVDEDLRCQAESAVLSAVFTFEFREPPEDFLP